jgi:hypothetical protein
MLLAESTNCTKDTNGPCGKRTTFNCDDQTTCKKVGIYATNQFTDTLSLLGNESGAQVAETNVIFGNILPQDSNSTLQLVYALYPRTFFAGIFGLAADPVSLPGIPAHTTLLSTMFNWRSIPSKSFSYTAVSVNSIGPPLI